MIKCHLVLCMVYASMFIFKCPHTQISLYILLRYNIIIIISIELVVSMEIVHLVLMGNLFNNFVTIITMTIKLHIWIQRLQGY